MIFQKKMYMKHKIVKYVPERKDQCKNFDTFQDDFVFCLNGSVKSNRGTLGSFYYPLRCDEIRVHFDNNKNNIQRFVGDTEERNNNISLLIHYDAMFYDSNEVLQFR